MIFSENNRFYPTLYNNLKGWIRHIKKETAAIQFDIEVDMALTEFAAMAAGFDLLECDVPGHSLIRFTVDHYIDDGGRERKTAERLFRSRWLMLYPYIRRKVWNTTLLRLLLRMKLKNKLLTIFFIRRLPVHAKT